MKLKPLVSMMALLPVMVLPTTTAVFASDLSLYRGNSTGKTSILLMLDTSGSMGISSLVLPKDNSYGSPGDITGTSLCNRVSIVESGSPGSSYYSWAYNLSGFNVNGLPIKTTSNSTNSTAIEKSVSIDGTTITYHLRGCTNGATWQYDRLSRLKDAIIPLLAGTKLKDSTKIGLGQFSSKTGLNISGSQIKLIDSHSGAILVENAVLNSAQRIKLAQKIASFQSLDNITYGNGKQNVAIASNNREYATGTTLGQSSVKKSSTTYPLGTEQYKTAGGTPTVQAYAEAGAYMMGTNTGIDNSTATKIDWIYDGSMTMQKINADEQVHFICVELGTNALTNSDFMPSGVSRDVKQCVNNWPSFGGKSVSDGTISAGVYKPNGVDATTGKTIWYKFPNRTELEKEMPVMANGWDTLSKLPAGWRYGGWMKVAQEPLDIEPIVGKSWGPYANSSAYGIVAYRTNPFALVEKATTNASDSYTDNLVGGFKYSVGTSKNDAKTNYNPGGSTSSCDGNGVYMLTDGAPNSTNDNIARSVLNYSLSQSAYQFSAKPSVTGVLVSPLLKSNLFVGETGGWEYIGEYAKKLADSTKNPAGMKIRTAVVGFGASFEGLTKKSDGTYDCDSTTNLDIKNACKWGSNAYGDGGFYQASNSDDIANSIIDFVNKVDVTFTPSSLGSISVPRDPLDQTKYMTQGFFPMVMPMEDTSFRTWAGNLKKYNIVGGTLKDSSGNAIYKLENNQQVINSSAKDLWSNATSGSDHSLINSGGAWNKIPVPSTAQESVDAISNINSERKVYTVDGSSLKKVTKENLATDFTGTGALTGIYNVNQRLALLNYLGYKTTFPTTQIALTASNITTLAVNPASPYRYLGGVVHSTPLMVTKESTVSALNTVGTRKEYTVYGSMDGGLHIVDASTGKEQSVFVPKEILDNQYDTLASSTSKGVSGLTGLAYGVDAPWVADNTFKVQTTTSNGAAATKYIANKMNIYGGLRMGGKAIYGLDILNPASPELLFNITPTTTGFSRLAQIWSKPTVAEIRVKGERKKVLIFGGGYDADVYEKPAASFTEPSSTYGNALYVVDATTGALIWMSSSDTSGVADAHKKTIQSDLKYSVVGQPVVRDYDADGLTDMIYFADLGGQIFRVDLNNNNQMSKTTDTKIAIRVQPLAQLRTTGATPFVPRFYDRLSTAVFDDGQNRFVLVTAGSGNRSFPLEAENGGKNKIYGLIDRDAAADGLEKSAFTPAPVITPDLLSNTGILGKTVTKQITDTEIAKMKLITGSTMLRGWSFELRSVDTGNYARSFEESQLITGDLYVSLYDPKATLTGTVNGCGGGVTGISTTHRICMPYGDCAAYIKTSYQGINGPAFGVVNASDPRKTSLVGPIAETKEVCIGKCPAEKTALTEQNLPTYSQVRKIKPVRWFEW
ncbi:type IV pilus assembly protein PilY1 [Acinetobacter kyonggiensis]|uniref:Type IV pilus assembly protein PilY1 n=2 Tax=Acinetobacter kyonggiensis TaxID=595670 RepID=A0A1H3J952_9GAMM|nr:type IV pilus assembly protein PilY1 [Acinetobacter kyonggiensis]